MNEHNDTSKSPGEPASRCDEQHRRDKALAEIKALRRELPPGFKFDREEANDRGSS
jgi:hypothetical protein